MSVMLRLGNSKVVKWKIENLYLKNMIPECTLNICFQITLYQNTNDNNNYHFAKYCVYLTVANSVCKVSDMGLSNSG